MDQNQIYKELLIFDPLNKLLLKLNLFSYFGIIVFWQIVAMISLIIIPFFVDTLFIHQLEIPSSLDVSSILDQFILLPLIFSLSFSQVNIHKSIIEDIAKGDDARKKVLIKHLIPDAKWKKKFYYCFFIVSIFVFAGNFYFSQLRLTEANNWFAPPHNPAVLYGFYYPITSIMWLMGILIFIRFVSFRNRVIELYKKEYIPIDLTNEDGYWGLKYLQKYLKFLVLGFSLEILHMTTLTHLVILDLQSANSFFKIYRYQTDMTVGVAWLLSILAFIYAVLYYLKIFPPKKYLLEQAQSIIKKHKLLKAMYISVLQSAHTDPIELQSVSVAFEKISEKMLELEQADRVMKHKNLKKYLPSGISLITAIRLASLVIGRYIPNLLIN